LRVLRKRIDHDSKIKVPPFRKRKSLPMHYNRQAMTVLASDVSTLDGILHALYEVLSGPAGQRYRTLFMDGARMIVVVAVGGEKPRARLLAVEDYIRRVEPIFAVEDFWERETRRQTEAFGRVAHVLSTYESLRDPEGPPFERGANSMQLFYDDSRWWVVSIMWNTSRSA
jgi:hypothetical protein